MIVTPVVGVAVQPDSLGEFVLLTLQSTTGGRITFGLSPSIVRLILEHLPKSLENTVSSRPTKQ